MKNTFEHKGIYFYEGTPIALADKLINIREQQERIVVDYGDTTTKQSWGEVHDITGYVAKTTGIKPMLILVHNKRSHGGGILLTDCILNVKTSKGKNLLYQL